MHRKKCPDRETRRAIKRDEEITQRLDEDRKQRRKDLKILLLGSAGCGKSTFIKTARLIGDKSTFSEEYRKSFRSAIFTSIVQLMHRIIRRLDESDSFLKHELLEPHILLVLATATPYEQETLDPELSNSLGKLWKEELIKKEGYEMVESEGLVIEYAAKHYLDDLERISSSDYVPNPEDVVKLHRPTQGIEETVFELHGMKMSFFEVGHMISERRKWLPYADDLKAVAFMIPCSMYDCDIGEDPLSNPLRAALCDFKILMESQHEWLQHKPIMLLFNGGDKFKEKLQSKPLEGSFPDFKGSENTSDAGKYVFNLFLNLAKDLNPDQRVYAQFTGSLNRTNVWLALSVMQGNSLLDHTETMRHMADLGLRCAYANLPTASLSLALDSGLYHGELDTDYYPKEYVHAD